jgi:hypothetical protein
MSQVKTALHFVVSVDSIEKITGIDFFPKDDTVENSLEKVVIINLGFN